MSIARKEKHTDEFLALLNQLLDKGVTQSAISNQLDLHRNRISHIKARRSSATKEMIDDLIAAYPELGESSGDSQTDTVSEEIAELRREMAMLREENEERRKEYRKTIDRLLSTIEKLTDKIN